MKSFVLTILGFTSALAINLASAEDAVPKAVKPGVAIVKPQRAPVQGVVKPGIERQELRAQLLPLNYTVISAEIGAKIERFYFREGESRKRLN